ncbi:hypothetical protein ACPFP2_04260 [Micromonospora citrea]
MTAFTDAFVRLWERKQRTLPAPHHGPILKAARRWTAFRARHHVHTQRA